MVAQYSISLSLSLSLSLWSSQRTFCRHHQLGSSKNHFAGIIRKMSGGEVVVTAARVYRDLLKAVVKHVGKEDHKSHFTDFVKTEFRKKKAHSLEKINLARNYTYLLNSIHSHKTMFGIIRGGYDQIQIIGKLNLMMAELNQQFDIHRRI
ncbi:unnamed protein product [Brassica rapa subsp. narinosa]